MRTEASAIGSLLREWRAALGMSQLDLALAAGVSSRHVSFIETGRAAPSRAMVLRLAETLDVPLRERNTLLTAAGFAPLFRESALDHAALAPVKRALELILRSHEPFPAALVDGAWNVLLANDAQRRLLPLLLPEGSAWSADARPLNTLRLVLDPAGLRPRISNWEQVAHALAHRLRRKLREPRLAPDRARLFEELLALPGVRAALASGPLPPEAEVLVPLRLEVHGRRLSLFTTIATIGVPLDVTLEELHVETLFPADDETEQALRALGRG
jgi:transcriptional regulator with XRE-family HTH domain